MPCSQILFGLAVKSGAFVAQHSICAKGIFQYPIYVSFAKAYIVYKIAGEQTFPLKIYLEKNIYSLLEIQ